MSMIFSRFELSVFYFCLCVAFDECYEQGLSFSHSGGTYIHLEEISGSFRSLTILVARPAKLRFRLNER
jgi:hypothetical protein